MASSVEPPDFQEASRCDVCKCSFNTFRRRHHCRCCGRTLCNEHSSHQMALPQFSILSDVRVCADCFNNSHYPNRLEKDGPKASFDGGITNVTDSVSRLDIGTGAELSGGPSVEHHSRIQDQECICGMPLCICQSQTPTKDILPEQKKTNPTLSARLNPKPKKTYNAPNSKGSTSNNNLCSSIDLGLATNSTLDKSHMDYEVTGEGLREAIKNNDVVAVKKLLSEGVDANYCDKQGFSLLHLAALFNHGDTTFILMEYGARLDCKNAQGETPLDCAPISLQYKMRKKLEEASMGDQVG